MHLPWWRMTQYPQKHNSAAMRTALIGLGAAICALVAITNEGGEALPMMILLAVAVLLLVVLLFDDVVVSVKQNATEANAATQLRVYLAAVGNSIVAPLHSIYSTAVGISAAATVSQRAALLQLLLSTTQSIASQLDDAAFVANGKSLGIENRPTNLAIWFNQIGDSYRAKAQDRGLVWECEFNCFGHPNDAIYEVDQRRLTQLVCSLLDNALKFTRRGGIKLSVKCDAASQGDAASTLVIEVNDTGSGIPIGTTKDLMLPLRHIATSCGRMGLGMGLPTVANIALSYRGVVSVASRIDFGSKFTVAIRAVRSSPVDTDDMGAQHADDSVTRNSPADFCDVLVLGSEEVTAKSTAAFIRRVGYKVEVLVGDATEIERRLDNLYEVVVAAYVDDLQARASATAVVRRRLPGAFLIAVDESETYSNPIYDAVVHWDAPEVELLNAVAAGMQRSQAETIAA